LLHELRANGLDIIYSSELVPPDIVAPAPRADASPLQRANDALAAHGLTLRKIGPRSYVVVRLPAAMPGVAVSEEPLAEVSVYASRYAIDGGLAEPRELSPTDVERVPGSHDDALRALHSLPGLASNASARPYIRGSLSEDVLVRYDGIALLDPYHLKNFQSLISAIDPAAIDRIEVFSGGFPVRYGTRSGGVIDIAAPRPEDRMEIRANLSLISGGVSGSGKMERWPVEWLGAIRRSVVDFLDPVEDSFGKPEFSDTIGRLRWVTERGSWTAGWLLLNDRLDLGANDDEESASAQYRDEYLWLARDYRFDDALQMRASLVVTSADREREGRLLRPGVAAGRVAETRGFHGLEFANDWTYERDAASTFTFGGGLAATRANYRYSRHSDFAPEVASAFDRNPVEDVDAAVTPRVLTYSLYGANRRKWSRFEAEVGLRLDGQHYDAGGDHTQLSPRLNLRYDLRDALRLYASAGRFTQAQHVEEWRVEEGQRGADAAQVSVHSILGLEYDTVTGMRVGIEAYSKQWTTVAPYFDNRLDPFSLLPDLAPDRVRVTPRASEAVGLEVSARKSVSDAFTAWGTFAWSRVADHLGSGDVLRSWDQPLSINAGLAWKGSNAQLSVLGGWHRGWPRTPMEVSPLVLAPRNSGRWGDFYSLDLRGSWTWSFASGDVSVVLDVTNSTNHGNECCATLQRAPDAALTAEVDDWLPTLVNLGFTYRWRQH
jgi:outer membrane receptor protein involved in Fe transport